MTGYQLPTFDDWQSTQYDCFQVDESDSWAGLTDPESGELVEVYYR